ncbi:MAG TPA: CBS domain-containing protein [Verrucomicrobiae bacterium]|nr:CBS domain-containing protein [Verrucomicrobiae bacterium]
MNVSMWMAHDPATITPETSATEAAKLMAQRHVRRLLVVEPRSKGLHLLGIISAKDVIHAFPPHVNPFAIEGPDAHVTRTTVGEIMTANPRAISPETPLEEAAALMCELKIGSLPVLRDKTLAGIITESDIFRAFASFFGSDEKGARITFDTTQGEDVFELMGSLSKRHKLKVSSLIRTQHDELPVCVVRVVGDGVDQMLDELWNSGHPVVNVIRFEKPVQNASRPATTVPFEPFLSHKPGSCGLYPST